MTRLLALAVLLVALHGPPVAAQVGCGSYKDITDLLGAKYSESRIGHGMTSAEYIAEIWVNPKTGTWTILEVYPDGKSCLVAVGNNWEIFEPTTPGDDA